MINLAAVGQLEKFTAENERSSVYAEFSLCANAASLVLCGGKIQTDPLLTLPGLTHYW